MSVVVNPVDSTGLGGYLFKPDERWRLSRSLLSAKVDR